MKKYFYIFKSELQSNLQYMTNILVRCLSSYIIVYILISLWKYIYSDPSEIINGYSVEQMIWYVIVTETLWNILSGRKLCKKICTDVKSGNIAYNINKPYSYIGYVISNHLGNVTISAFIYVVSSLMIGILFVGHIPSLNITNIILLIISCIFAILINILFILMIGLFSFKLEDAMPFYWLYSKVIIVIGTIFPIEYFPIKLRGILSYSPIYVVSYGPAKLFVDFSYSMFLKIFIAQIIYFVICSLICKIIYKKGVKKLNVNGG